MIQDQVLGIFDGDKEFNLGVLDLNDFDKMKGSGSMSLLQNAKEFAEKKEKSKHKGSKHPTVMSDTQVNLGNYMDVQYSGSVFFGSEPEEMNLIFDTGSDMVVVETDLCPSCIQPVFNTSESTTYTRVGYSTRDDLHSMNYLSASLVGYNATDTVSIDQTAQVTVSNMPFMAVAT